jgi:A/G-specific adenine glycosylase
MYALFQERLLTWFDIHKRDLPWRNTQNPYYIWLSEIILQQTRVAQGLPYYEKFVQKYPTLQDLANAPQDEFMKLWEGLGYYSRAKNMLHTAQYLVQYENSTFPNSFEKLKQLKGIGNYTAAAIASFAFNEPVAVVDGNVQRVLARWSGIFDDIKHKKVFQNYADAFLNKENPALHNQAMMEFGALQCTPKNPDCKNCIMQDICYAYAHSVTEQLPVKVKKLKKPQKTAFFYYIENEYKEILVQKRKSTGIWANLYEIPNTLDNEPELPIPENPFQKGYLKHVFTHFVLYITWFHYKTKKQDITFTKENYKWISLTDLQHYGFPVPVQKIIKEINSETLFSKDY